MAGTSAQHDDDPMLSPRRRTTPKADTANMRWIVFSKDRPLQLDAALASMAARWRDPEIGQVAVLYAASTQQFESLYAEVAASHPAVHLRRERSFKRDLLDLVSPTRYVGFVVDDTVFVRDFSLATVLSELDVDGLALGFSLRLGRNTTYCYPLDAPQLVPAFAQRRGGVLAYEWPDASYDFGYPLELSSSVYRTADLQAMLRSLLYSNPNTLEAQLAARATTYSQFRPRLLCFERSVAFSIPANIVQSVAPNRASTRASQSATDLAALFESGSRIDVRRYLDFSNNGCHQDLPLEIQNSKQPPPAVSVVIPCFNQAQYLPDAVASVVGQTFTDWEIVIVDDGSPDDTALVASDLIARHGARRIKLIRQANGGLARARNAGISESRGRFILPLDADDMLDPRMLERTVAILVSNPQVAIAYTDVRRFGAEEGVERAAEFDPAAIVDGNQLNYCSLFRRGVWYAVGGYNPNMVYGYEDWDFWVGCAERGYVARRIPEPLFRYRVRPGSMYATARARDAELRRQLRRNHPDIYSLRARARRRARATVGTCRRRLNKLLMWFDQPASSSRGT
jgi:glycosyltransferase involved in cell wall biosynthesis